MKHKHKTTIRVMLIDDEENALNIMELFLADFKEITIVGKYQNPLKALADIKQNPVDAVFLDVEMPGINGLQLAKEILELERDIEILFVTVYSMFAVHAFEIQSLDYILKPLLKERFIKAVQRLIIKKSNFDPFKPRLLAMQCFNRFELHSEHGEKSVTKWKTYKVKELCAYLVHHDGMSVTTDTILEDVWHTTSYDKARANLYTCIHHLRRVFDDLGYPDILVQEGKGYHLQTQYLQIDLIELEGLLAENDLITVANVEQYRRIIEIYKGEYLADLDVSWANEKKQSIRKAWVSKMNLLSEYYAYREDWQQVQELLKRVLHFFPDSEDTGRSLMRCYIQLKQYKELLILFTSLKFNVEVELGISLEDETIELYEYSLKKLNKSWNPENDVNLNEI